METVKGPDRDKRIEDMVVRYQGPLLRLCYAYLHDEELARDAVQETFIKAYRGLDRFREEASEKTWLTRIAINTCKDLRRSGWFRHMDRRIVPEDLPEQSREDEVPDGEVTEAIRSLPPKLRTMILLRYYEGLSLKETAAAAGISLATAKRQISKANQLLHERLEGWYTDE